LEVSLPFYAPDGNVTDHLSISNGATGALIPTIERTYGITYARVSILFVCTFLGYIGAAVGTGALARRIGFGNALCVSIFVELIGVGEVLVVVVRDNISEC
jgi:fucose permease